MNVDAPTVVIGRAVEARVTFGAPVVATNGRGYVRLPILVEEQLEAAVGVDPGSLDAAVTDLRRLLE